MPSLEFLRDAIDFSVVAIKADDRIRDAHDRSKTFEADCEEEITRVQGFVAIVDDAVEKAVETLEGSSVAHCAARVFEAAAEAKRQQANAIRNEMAAHRARTAAEDHAVRAEIAHALAVLLSLHDPPDGTSTTRITLGPGGYMVTREGKAAFGLAWTLELEVVGTAWSSPVHVGQFDPTLEIFAPQTSGLIKKEVRFKIQHLQQMVVSGMVIDVKRTSLALRNKIGSSTGFDIVDTEGSIQIDRVGDELASGTFELSADEQRALRAVVQMIHASATFRGGRFVRAHAGNTDFMTLPEYKPFVAKLVGMLTPIAHEISEQESRSMLAERFTHLPDAERAIFSPLGLDGPTKAVAKLPSREPPPLPSRPPPKTVPPPRKTVPPKGPPRPAKKEITLSDSDIVATESLSSSTSRNDSIVFKSLK